MLKNLSQGEATTILTRGAVESTICGGMSAYDIPAATTPKNNALSRNFSMFPLFTKISLSFIFSISFIDLFLLIHRLIRQYPLLASIYCRNAGMSHSHHMHPEA